VSRFRRTEERLMNHRTDKIEVRCTAAVNLDLSELTPLQGGLKELNEANFEKLRQSILKHGITFPFFVWQSDGENYILDGTQRDRVLKRMAEEGYEVPPLPCALIEAKNRKDAAEKILLISSQYGRVTDEGLYEFLSTNELDFGELEPLLELPALDLDDFKEGWMAEPDFSPTSADDQGKLDKKNPVTCPECGHEFIP
jgi:ParB-like nuclease domain